MTAGAAAAEGPAQQQQQGKQPAGGAAGSGMLIPPTVRESDRASFIATQRERLRTLLSALDREAANLAAAGKGGEQPRANSISPEKGEGSSNVRFSNPWAVTGGDGAGSSERPPERS